MSTHTFTTTGSWADSTHSVFWLTNTSNATQLKAQHRNTLEHLISLAVVLVTTIMASANLVTVYGSFGAWLGTALTAGVLGCAIAYAGTSNSLRLWWQIVMLACAQWIIGPIVCLNDTTIAHGIPTISTIREGWVSSYGAFKYVIAIAPPVGTRDGALMALWTLVLWVSTIAGALAVASQGRLSIISAIIIIAMLCACALLGTHTGVLPIALGIIIIAVLIIWVSWRWQVLELARWVSAIIIMTLACAVSVGGCLLIPQHRTILRDHYEPPLSPYDYTSPLSGLRSYIKDHKKDTLLTVSGLPQASAVRLAVMDRFDGNVWNLSDSRSASDSSNYSRVGNAIENPAQGEHFTAKFTIDQGLHDDWLPLAGAASSVSFPDHDRAGNFFYNVDTDTGILPDGTFDGLTYTETGVIPKEPTEQQIAKAKAQRITQPKAQDIPDSVSTYAASVAGGKETDGAAAQALVDNLREHGWFSHGLASDYPSNPGHGNYRIDHMLGGNAMVGDSEQYASAMALMARELGLPSRVVLGFLPKDKDGEITDNRTQTRAGKNVVEFTGNDIAAWVEIRFNDYGWVPFYPTPKETKVPDDNQNLTPPNPQNLVRQPPLPLTDPLRDNKEATGQSSLSGTDAADPVSPSAWQTVGHIAALVGIYGSPLWALLLICAMLLAVKAFLLARARTVGRPSARVAAGWHVIDATALQSGLQTHGTRREQASQIAQQLHVQEDSLNALSKSADYAAFSGEHISEQEAQDYWKNVDSMRKAMIATMPWIRQMRTRLSLRGMSFKYTKGSKRGITRIGRSSRK